jgi:uncharacterized glyoxalase superfamily protein PhnB
MHTGSNAMARSIVPTLCYRDVAAAIVWLCDAFGFEKRLVADGPDGSVRYAELVFGDGMIMVGPVEESAVGGLMTQPEQVGGAETQMCYLFVADAVAHRTRAVAAGAELVLDMDEDGAGGGYSCRDPEGHIWNFGTYDPWRHQPQQTREGSGFRRLLDGTLRRLALSIGFLAITFAAAVVVAWVLALAEPHALAASSAGPVGEQVVTSALDPRAASERELGDLREQLRVERAARQAAESAAQAAEEQRAHQLGDRARLENRDDAARRDGAVEGIRRVVEEVRRQLAAAEKSAQQARQQLDAERVARLQAEQIDKEVREQLAKERSAREAAERTNRELREHMFREHRALAHRHQLPPPPPKPIVNFRWY